MIRSAVVIGEMVVKINGEQPKLKKKENAQNEALIAYAHVLRTLSNSNV